MQDTQKSHWPAALDTLAAADDLHVSPFREDGKTYGTPTWIWSVVVAGELYARAYHGSNSRWYQAALRQQAGRVSLAGFAQEVLFKPVQDEGLNVQIDAAYRAKYQASPYLAPMVSARARAATVQLVPSKA